MKEDNFAKKNQKIDGVPHFLVGIGKSKFQLHGA